jgi:carboxymethylenebutenolidase
MIKIRFLSLLVLTCWLISAHAAEPILVAAADQRELDATATAHESDQPEPTPIATTSPRQPVTGESIEFGAIDGRKLRGYLSKPVNAPDNAPALLVIHEWWGFNDNIKRTTDRLAGEGFIALAIDLYDGQSATIPKEAIKLMTAMMAKPEEADETIRQAYQYLDSVVGAPRIGSIGWCMGGRWSLRTAVLFPEDVDATVIYYGTVTSKESDLAPLQMPVLGNFASNDPVVKLATVEAFEAEMQRLGKDIDVKVYEGAGHGFSNPSGMAYDQVAATDAWARSMVFLNKHLVD